MESEAVLPEPKHLLLVLDEGHHSMSRARWRWQRGNYRLPVSLATDLFKLVATCRSSFALKPRRRRKVGRTLRAT